MDLNQQKEDTKNKLSNEWQMELLPTKIDDLEMFRSKEVTTIFCRGFCFFTYNTDDLFSRNVCLVQLHISGKISLKFLSIFFGIGYQQCSNILVRYKKDGLSGILDCKGNSKHNSTKITEEIGQEILRLRSQGNSYEEIRSFIRFKFKKTIANQTIRAWVHRLKKKEVNEELGEQLSFDDIVLPLKEEEKAGELNSYAGSMILYSMIERSGFLRPFEENIEEELGRRKSSRGVRRVLLSLFFLHALRFKSVEQTKNLVSDDFREIVGGDFLRLQDLRYALDDIVQSLGFERSMDLFFKDLLVHTDLGDLIYFTDGHFSTYYGKRKVPKGWDPRRQMGYRGRNSIFLHNSLGENVYFFESPENTSLSCDIRRLMSDVELLGKNLKRRTLIFDRGGYSQDCFRFLNLEKKMYFVTYLKNKKKEELVDDELFEEREFVASDVIVKYKLYEKPRRWTKYGKVRVIILQNDDGSQVPIITNNPFFSGERIIYYLKKRWREENAFKYMIEHFGIDLLTTYKIESAPDHEVLRLNPERQKIINEIKLKKNELLKTQSDLGKKISEKNLEDSKAVIDFLNEEKQIRNKIKNIEVDIILLEEKKKNFPTKIKSNLKDDHVIIAQKRRLLINAIKVMNYNAEKWLQIMFKKHHRKHDETLSLIRNLWRLPGRIIWKSREVRVELKPHGIRAMRECLDKVLKELNENNNLRLPDGSRLKIIQTH